MQHFLTHLREQVIERPEQEALTDYKGHVSYTYRSLAEQMAKLDQMLSNVGIKAGDKVALCGRNSSNWGVAFMAIMASRRVAVSILPDFTPEGIRDLVNHSEAKLLFVGHSIWKNMLGEKNTPEALLESMPSLELIVSMEEYLPIVTKNEDLAKQFTSDNIEESRLSSTDWWNTDLNDDLCLINYTSGTTSSPKGVMLSYRSLSSNVEQGLYLLYETPAGKNIVSILPLAHMYGLAMEFIAHVAYGAHVFFITKNPTPTILMEVLNDVRPYIMFCVPLVLEKVFRSKVFSMVKKPHLRVLMAIPGINIILKKKIREGILNAMGGNIRYFVIGGAALNQEVEQWMKRVNIPYIVGYGMTECGPLIAASPVGTFAHFSCGKALPGMEIKIDSSAPHSVEGEILTSGANLMLGYYKNEEATRAVMTEDGWLRTGDLGILNRAGDLFIKGRSKNMLLGPSGQNIYPEELEDKVNSITGVAETVVVDRDGHLVALIYPDPIYLRRFGQEKMHALVARYMKRVNKGLPAYSQIHSFEFVEQEFEKTPKRSIKRFLYK